MEPSKVFFTPVEDGESIESYAEKTAQLFDAASITKCIEEGDLTAIKLHFGEKGNEGYIKPPCIKAIVDKTKDAGGLPFLTDSNTLYKGQRSDAVRHILQAYEHGFTMENVGAPVIISDGLIGRDELEVEIKGTHYDRVALGSVTMSAQSMIVATHMTGHDEAGFGATLKNIGMGMASRKGKLKQHSDVKPFVKSEACTVCKICIEWCPEDAITIQGEAALINTEKCIGCGECLVVCHYGAVSMEWGNVNRRLQEKMAEHALGAVKGKEGKVAFLTFLNHLTKNCDCLPTKSGEVILPDVGIMASLDPVAIDQAALDVIKEKTGKDLVKEAQPKVDGTHQLAHAEKIGLGSRKYELVEIT